MLQRTAAQRDRWRAEIPIDGVPDQVVYIPIDGLPARSGRVGVGRRSCRSSIYEGGVARPGIAARRSGMK